MFKTVTKAIALFGLIAVMVSSIYAGGQQEEAPTDEAVEERETVRVLATFTGDYQNRFEAVLEDFTERTGIPAEYEPAGEDMGTVLGTQIEGGDPPDVALLPQPGLMREFAAQGDLVPVEDTVGDLVDANYAEVWRELGSYDDDLYGVWYKAANKSFFYYNTEIFGQAGVEPPETWSELMEVAGIVSDFGIRPFSIGGGSAWTLTDWFENIYIHSAGPERYDQLIDHEIPWTHDSVREAMEIFGEIVSNRDWLAGGVDGTLEATHPEGIVRPFLDPPQAAIAYGADFSVAAITDETDAEIGETAGFFDFPTIDGSGPSVIGGGDVAVALSDNEETQEMMRYLASPEAAEVWAPLGGFTSANQQVDPDVYPDELSRGSAEALQEAEVFRFDLSDLQPSAFGATDGQGMFGLLQDYVRNPDELDEILEQLEREAAQAHGSD